MSSRAYVVGLPVVVIVDDDGKVHLSVDAGDLNHKLLGESQDGMDEPYGDEQIIADSDTIDAAFEAKTMTAGIEGQEEED